MRVIQTKIVSVHIIVFFLLATATLGAVTPTDIPNANGACCVPAYGPVFFYTDVDYAREECYASEAAFVENCFVSNPDPNGPGILTDPSIYDSGCCCIPLPQNNYEQLEIGDSDDIGKFYCQEISNSEFKPPDPTCAASCASTSQYFNVGGNIRLQNQTPLNGITIRETDSSQTAVSNAVGAFSFDELFVEGNHEFSVEVPANYYLACEQGVTFTKFVNANPYSFDIILDCDDREVIINECIPDWYTLVDGEEVSLEEYLDAGWGPCLVQGYQTREIWDATGCDNPSTTPDSYQICEDVIIVESCGNGEVDDGEQCDGNKFRSGDQIITTNEFSCTTIQPDFEGQITCTSTCTLDTTQCQIPCDCSSYDQCGDECQFECADADICQQCPNPVTFIPEAENYNGELFALYDSDLTDNENYPSYPLEYQLGTKDVTFNWFTDKRPTCAQDILGFELTACRESSDQAKMCDPEATYTKSIDGTMLKSYTFEDILEPQTRFCYNMVTIKQSGRDSLFEEGNYPCFETGYEMCMNPQAGGLDCLEVTDSSGTSIGPTSCERYPLLDTLVNHQVESDACDLGNVCVETEYREGDSNYPGAVCRAQQLCESCNGMFGLFADYGLNVAFEAGNVITGTQCEDILFSAQDGSTLPGFGDGFTGQCYKEESKTLFSFYESCQEVTTCYDYKSKGTCGFDPCFKFTNVTSNNGVITDVISNGCEWIEYNSTDTNNLLFGDELGLGVCRPQVEDQQNCMRCDSDSPSGFCNQDMCNIYGTCFQKEELELYQENAVSTLLQDVDMPACLNSQDMSCILYDNIDDCIGEQGNRAEPKFDVLFEDDEYLELRPERRIAGSNKQLAYSNDVLGFGDCEWNQTENVCYKNSNAFVEFQVLDDCGIDSGSGVTCYRDVEPPITTIYLKNVSEGQSLPFYGTGEIENIPFSVEDDYSLYEETITYMSILREDCVQAGYVPCVEGGPTYCLNSTSPTQNIIDAYDAECEIYPRRTPREMAQAVQGSNILADGGGEHLIVYFSEDYARNLEELQIAKVYIDNTAPKVNITGVDIKTYGVSEEEYLTDVIFNATISERSFCQAKLQDIDQSVFSQTEKYVPFNTNFEAVPPGENVFEFTTNYSRLVDGNYNFTIECIDDLSNIGSDFYNFTLNGDASIKVVSPLGGVYTNATFVVLNISTPYEAVCKYDKFGFEFDSETAQEFTMTNDRDEEGRFIHLANYGDVYENDTSGLYTLAISCAFEDDITQGKQGDLLFFTIDTIAPRAMIYDSDTFFDPDLSEWAESRNFQIRCDDSSSLTPLYQFGCDEIHYCVSSVKNYTAFNELPENFCGDAYTIKYQETEGQNELIANIRSLGVTDEYTYAYYYVVDAQGAMSDKFMFNTKIRDQTTYAPGVVIY